MEAWTIGDLAAASGGILARGDAAMRVDRVCTDSRQVRPGDLFVALSGDRFDGHLFLEDAARRGAVGVLVTAGREPSRDLEVAVVRVVDPGRPWDGWHHGIGRRLGLTLVAVGGSNGKTTTKGFLGTLLGQRHRTAISPASYNNAIGVPLTLLGLRDEHEVAVVEVATNHPGELAPWCAWPRRGMG
jgi:UDP-N-acetylmuramyl pentapeptide synthase